MYRSVSQSPSQSRIFIASLLSFITLIAPIASGSAAMPHAAESSAAGHRKIESVTTAIKPNVENATNVQPVAVLAPAVTATLTDNIPLTTKVAPGSTINYTAVITNNGVASPADDALNAGFNAPLDTNTTYNAGTIHASPIAFNDTYNWVGNTQLDTSARTLSTVTANDVAVNASLPATATDTFNVIPQAGASTALGGVVSLAANGHFVYTPPLGRPNIADGASVSDSFIYQITNSADATLVGTGTVTINLSGRVWYLQAGAAGDGHSNTPSGSPSAMSTAADKSTDIFYIFSNAGSLNGLFTLENSQQLLGQGVALVVNTITLFTAAAPTPTHSNTTGNGVTLGMNNTLAGFNIGNCSGIAIFGSNVGTLAVNTLSITTTGAGLDLTGSGNPAVNVVLGALTSSGGAKNVNLVNLGGTISLASGALSGATGNAFDVSGGAAVITYAGGISNSGGKQVNIASMTGGSASFSGAISGSGTGINLNNNTGATFTFSGGIVLSTGANAAFAATGGGTINVTGTNTVTTTSGTAVNITDTIGASNVTFQSIAHNGNNTGIILSNTGTGTFNVTGTGTTAGSGGTIENIVGADAITLNNTDGLVTLKNMIIEDITASNDATAAQNTRSGIDGIHGLQVDGGLTLEGTTIRRISDNAILGGTNGVPDVATVWNGLTINNCTIEDTNRFGVASHGDANSEGTVRILGIRGTVNVTNNLFQRGAEFLDFTVTSGTMTMTVTNSDFLNGYKQFVDADASPLASVGLHGIDVTVQGTANAAVTIGDRNNAALACDFLNNNLASVRLANDPASTEHRRDPGTQHF